jgi:hypothetical protein
MDETSNDLALQWSTEGEDFSPEAMSRFLLEDSTAASISRQLPSLESLQKLVSLFAKDLISIAFLPNPQSTIPIAAVCLQDTMDTLVEARYALYESFAHRIWYKEISNPPQEMAAVFFTRFYADDTALRLYSAGEHLANAIIFMLEITEQQLTRYRQTRTSQQSVVGHFLAAEEPNHPITQAIASLVQSEQWQDTVKYRNKWVHEQPPTVDGLGLVYNRSKRWRRSGTLNILEGGGDKPDYSVDDILGFVKPALFLFTDTLTKVVEFYIELLKEQEITFNQDMQGKIRLSAMFDSLRKHTS